MKRKLAVISLIVAVAFLLSAAAVMAADPPKKKKFKRFHAIVDAAFVKDIVDGKTKGLLIDSRPARKKFKKGHIPTAVNMYTKKWKKMHAKVLPQDKATLIVFYCEGPT
jgi:3-mercaptopyruvate sulfurtransferase SseA